MRDEYCLPGRHPPSVMFTGVTSPHPPLHSAIQAHILPFTLCPVLKLPHSILRLILYCYKLGIHHQVPLFPLLVNLACDVYAVLKNAYLIDNRHCAAAILLRIAIMHSLLCSHDYAALRCKTK